MMRVAIMRYWSVSKVFDPDVMEKFYTDLLYDLPLGKLTIEDTVKWLREDIYE